MTTLPGIGSGTARENLSQRFPDLNRNTLRQQIRQSPSLDRDTREAWRQKLNARIVRTPERQQALNDRLSEVDRDDWRQQRQDNRQSNREDWQQYRNGAREDWQNWYDDHYYMHYGWHNGCWHDGWSNYWDHMWHKHPLAVTFGLTCWGVNTMSYMFGTVSYSNPYYVVPSSGRGIDYSQPQIVVQEPASDSSTAEAAEISEAGLAAFEKARSEFRAGNYDAARRQIDEVIKLMPHDAVVHEFRALTLFALKRYRDAAAVLHSVLAVGPGWDWTTMSQLYPSTEVYKEQLRVLEAWVKDFASLPEGHFVLAYHYLTCGYRENATTELKVVVKILSDDVVSTRLLSQLTGEELAAGNVETEPSSTDESVTITQAQLIGKWIAKANDSVFKLVLSKDGRFSWSFGSKAGEQGISGVYAIKDSTLAMEPDGGGVMLAELRLDGTHLVFRQVGADSETAPLKFERN